MKIKKPPTKPKMRNPFALAAKSRRNSGPMGHHQPARERTRQEISYCEICHAPIDPDDDSTICIECEPAVHLPEPPDPIDDD